MQFDEQNPATADESFAPAAETGSRRRTASCPCGSARRYKHCCGRLEHEPVATLRRAALLMKAGEAVAAAQVLGSLRPEQIPHAGVALEAAEIYLDMHVLQPVSALLQRALDLAGSHPRIVAAQDECRALAERRATWQASGRNVRALLDRLNARARGTTGRIEQVHIVCKLDTIGGSERRALNLYRRLSAQARVTLWSTAPALPSHLADVPIRQITNDAMPSGGTVVLAGTYFDCGAWLESQSFDRVVICHNLSEQHESLTRRLEQIAANRSCPQVMLTFPSALFRDACGLPGLVEYSGVDIERFKRSSTAAAAGAALRIGRHGRAYPLKFHPNDPAFFRCLIARGHAVRILGGSVIADAFAQDTGQKPELLEVGALDASAFLEDLDVFVFRKHPRLFETGGTVILEAMAMQLPVIVFAEDCGYAEIIEHGKNGFLVSNETEALACIDRLQADPELRTRLGQAARATIVELMRQQECVIDDCYPGANAGSLPTRLVA